MPKQLSKEVGETEIPTKDGLPRQAYAIVGSKEDPGSWRLPHHDSLIYRAIKGKIGIEHTVDWQLVAQAVAAISRGGVDGRRIEATETEIIDAARHLAGHYIKAGLPLPDALAIIV